MNELQKEIEQLLFGYIGISNYDKIKEVSRYCEYVINNSKVLEKQIDDLAKLKAEQHIETVISKIDLLEKK
jgi:hypothetical protein